MEAKRNEEVQGFTHEGRVLAVNANWAMTFNPARLLSRYSSRGTRTNALIDAMRAQSIVSGNIRLARALARVSKLKCCRTTFRLISQGDSDNSIYFILLGEFGIQVNGRPLAVRRAGQTVGEMALIDARAKRSATVVALEDSVIARVSPEAFSKIADRNPLLWRNLAAEMAERLRQRNLLVRQRNAVPRLFLGSSSESLRVVQTIEGILRNPNLELCLWTGDVFRPSDVAIEALERIAYEADFGLFVLSPDDKVRSRGVKSSAPRDNVVFELGLSMGALGRKRTFILVPSNFKVKLPSDLHGVTYLPYKVGGRKSFIDHLKPACLKIQKAIRSVGAR